MTDFTSSVTATTRDAARTAIRSVLIEADPSLDLTSGGIVDSIIVEGNVAVAAQNQADVDAAYLNQQMKAIAAGTVTISDAQMDSLASNYFITRQAEAPATGYVTFIVRDNAQYTMPERFALRYGSYVYETTATYIVYPAETTGIDFTVITNIRLQAAYDTATGYQYQFQVPVTCTTATPGGLRVPGDVFTQVAARANIGRVEAATPFSGGTAAETNASMATRILSGITAKSLGGGQDQISALVASIYASAKASAVGVASAMQTRGRLNPFGVNTGGKLDVYVKTGGVGTTLRVASAIVLDSVARTVQLTLDRDSAAGAYTYVPVGLTGVTGMTGGISLSSTSLSQATLPSFNPEMATADLRGSANAVVTLNIVDTRKKPDLSFVVPMTTNGQSLPNTYGASIMYMPGVLEVADALYDDATRPPGLDVLVKAGAPCAVTMNMSISKPSNYNGPSAAELTASIAAAVNQLPMRQAYLDDFTISQIIKTASSSLTLQTLAMFGTVTAFDGSIVGVSQLGNKLTIPVDTAKKISYETTFFTTNVGSISVNLV